MLPVGTCIPRPSPTSDTPTSSRNDNASILMVGCRPAADADEIAPRDRPAEDGEERRRQPDDPVACIVTYTCSRSNHACMTLPKLTKLEHQIMEALWNRGASSVREIQEAFPEKDRPAYTTVQTMVYRLEAKKAIKRVKKIGNAHVFAAAISRSAAQRRLIDELLSFFGGRIQPVVAHLIESGKLTLDDVDEAKRALRKHAGKDEPKIYGSPPATLGRRRPVP